MFSMPHPILRAVANPPNPFQTGELEWEGPPPPVALQVLEDHTRSILSRNDSPDIGFDWSVNPYRGCMHACAYCYARPSHQYLDLGAGTDFDRRIVIKPRAPELLREAMSRPSWKGDLIVFSGNTDCYQPLEASYRLTRRCLEVCAEARNPVSVITKAALIERDADLLARLAREATCVVTLSVPFIDPDVARKVEPFAPTPARRLAAMQRLSAAGVPVAVNVAPIIPGLNDSEIPRILEAAHAAGARHAGFILVRLPGAVAPVFEARIREAFPQRADRILHRIQDCRGGNATDSRFGARMRGQGPYWQAIDALFRKTCARLGMAIGDTGQPPAPTRSTFRRPSNGSQLGLFDVE